MGKSGDRKFVETLAEIAKDAKERDDRDTLDNVEFLGELYRSCLVESLTEQQKYINIATDTNRILLITVDALDEAIGRATEMGRPVHATPGDSSLTGLTAPQTVAG
jgi:hypothetical protein